MATETELRLMRLHEKFEDLPQEPHFFCPKINDDDDEDYHALDQPGGSITAQEKKKRIDAYESRADVVLSFSLILAIPKEEASAWLSEWVDRTENFLSKCDACLRNWYLLRKPFLERLKEDYDDDSIAIIAKALAEFDSKRISTGLEKAKVILAAEGPMNAKKLAGVDITAVLALYEALCSAEYANLPENRVTFDEVFSKTQQRKPLRMGVGIIPTMTRFLFDEDTTRYKFAKVAWDAVESGSMTSVQYDWAVNDMLKSQIEDMAAEGTTEKRIKLFWEGIPVLLDAMSEDVVMHSLRGMQVQPDIYNLALQHLSCHSDEVLALVIKALITLMKKSAKAFWDALSTISPPIVAQQVLGSPAFRVLLTKSLSPDMLAIDGSVKMPLLALWVKTFMNSLPSNRRYEACESFTSQLFDVYRNAPHTTREGIITCTISGLVALQVTLDGWLSSHMNLTQQHIMVSQTLLLVTKYASIICQAAEVSTTDDSNLGRPLVAMSVVQLALSLDAKATRQEWRDIQSAKPIPQGFERQSSRLWEAFLYILAPGRTELAAAMLSATQPLSAIERFRPPKRGNLTDPKRLRFNAEFSKTAEAIGKILERLGEFSLADLDKLCSSVQIRTIDPVVASLVHSEDAIREAATSLLKTITDQDQRSDAIAGMLNEYLESFLPAFSTAVGSVIDGSYNPWAPLPHVVVLSLDVLNGLCDTTDGILRSMQLSYGGREVVSKWWAVQWRCIQYLFGQTRHWSKDIERKTLEDFCRDAIELASKLLDQDGMIASALGDLSKVGGSDSADGDAKSAAMKQILEPVRINLDGLVDMIHLRDEYLIGITVQILVKVLGRLAEFDLKLPKRPLAVIQNACTKGPDGKYLRTTNLLETQRAELLRALGHDGELETQVVEERAVNKLKDKPKKQSSLDAWSSSSPASSSKQTAMPGRIGRDHLDVTPALDKHRSLIESFRSRPAKPDSKALVASSNAFKEARQREKAEMARRKADAIAKAQALRAPTKTVPGEGSGLQGVAGIHGKEHGPQTVKSDIMVDSSEEEEEDESDDDLSALVDKSKTGKSIDEVERRRQLELLKKMPVKKIKIQRSAKDMRARLIPPMDVLHQAILEWDIFHEGNDPPNGYKCLAVSDTYGDPSQYKSTFFPLLVNEAWRSFVTAKDENTTKPFGIKIINRISVDKFLEVITVMPAVANKDRFLSEGDIVLLSKADNPLDDKTAPHCLARIWKTTFKKDNLEVAYRLSSRNNSILQVLLPGAEFFAIKITNMTTIEREYAALESLQYYDLMHEILKAAPSPKLEFGEAKVQSVMQNYQLNMGQAKAILNAKENDGFTLVQGPPGTGKTKTIVAMVGALLAGTLGNKNPGSVQITRPGGAQNKVVPKKLLVCAPSNAAVDELVLRLKAGVKSMTGTTHKINVLRLGRSEAINAAVKDVTLDELVKAKMDAETNKNGNVSERDKMHEEAGAIKVKLSELRPRLEEARSSDDRSIYNQLQREFDELKRRQTHIGAKIDASKDSGMTFARENEIKRRQLQQKILDEAQVLCATLSGSGHEMFKNLNVEFETVIIDEAAQCVELSALIPLKYGCSKCILVGDPKQLPPTVLSQSAARFGYDQSLFVRMQRNHPQDIHLLDTQYRMHPEISFFPSQEFYERRLVDGDDMLKLRHRPWHESQLLGPYRFFDVEGIQQKGNRGQSLVNVNELEVAMQLYHRFATDFGDCNERGKIGIITPYKAQLYAMKQRFTDKYGPGIINDIEFNTTDAFQGRECEIIIFSCVRASPTGGIGFMTDIRRMNVGLTRAKSSLWILGNSRALMQGEFWAKLIQDSKKRDRYTNGNVPALLRRPYMKSTPPTATPATTREPSNDNRGPRAGTQSKDIWMKDLDEDVEMEDVDEEELEYYPAPDLPRIGTRKRRPDYYSEDVVIPPPKKTALPQPVPELRPRVGPVDPSAMQVLGLAPPPGPSPPPPQPDSQPPRDTSQRPMPPKRRPAADPFIKRKPNRR